MNNLFCILIALYAISLFFIYLQIYNLNKEISDLRKLRIEDLKMLSEILSEEEPDKSE